MAPTRKKRMLKKYAENGSPDRHRGQVTAGGSLNNQERRLLSTAYVPGRKIQVGSSGFRSWVPLCQHAQIVSVNLGNLLIIGLLQSLI